MNTPVLRCLLILLACSLSLPAAVSDLVLTKNVLTDSISLGSALTYTFIVSNAGPDIATNVVLTDRLPAIATLTSAHSDTWNCFQTNDDLICRLDAVAVGATAALTLTVIPDSAGIVCDFATVISAQSDPFLANNQVAICASVLPLQTGVDLSVSIVAIPNPVALGNNLAYAIRVRNNGPQPATGVVLTDILPVGVTFVSASPGCTNVGGVITCAIGRLSRGASIVKTIVVAPVLTGEICNRASVSGNGGDPVTANNTDSVCTVVTTVPDAAHDLAVVKITAPPAVALSAKKPSQTKLVTVQIQNRSPHAETLTNLENLVTLRVESLGLRPDLIPVLHSGTPQRNLPVTLQPKELLNVYFDVTFTTTCVNDPARSTRKSPGHED
jgi:uncharacterized repeat protein (TIGR01451 family)